ncbi:hypothetical protein PRZ48_005232 [Zasmidium cellare]|uniref:Heterokaryon incompatibility domain-containing protein n=1 Tax=Zasmidium cellare TaxID=395010 RepID=A0ABR0ERV7_ZASCE|nr:hypothetical protein PRZ48_005232 [Zasmidium cellare]
MGRVDDVRAMSYECTLKRRKVHIAFEATSQCILLSANTHLAPKTPPSHTPSSLSIASDPPAAEASHLKSATGHILDSYNDITRTPWATVDQQLGHKTRQWNWIWTSKRLLAINRALDDSTARPYSAGADMASLGTLYTRNLSKEPQSIVTPVTPGNVDQSNRISRSKELCGTCGSIDFGQLFKTRTKQQMGPIRQAFRNWWCPFCSLITEELSKANPHLDVHNDIVESSLNYSIRFYRSMAESDIHYNSIIVGLESSSVTRYGSDQWYTTVSLDLVGDIRDTQTGQTLTSGVRRPVRASLDATDLKEWLETCDSCHTAHVLERTTSEADIHAEFEQLQAKGRFRLIDVKANKVVSLRHTPRYFALSYIWGPTMASYHASNLLSTELSDSLPRTVQDAMLLVERLGEQYLWVDTLCIDQPNLEEKHDIVAHMGSIYRNAYATIVAASAEDSSIGISALYPSSRRAETPRKMKSQHNAFSLLPSKPQLEGLVERCKWSSRAWTFQERLLSKRCIFFFEDEVILQCANGVLREAYQIHHTHTLLFSAASLFHLSMNLTVFGWTLYCSAVADYSRRNMTVAGDRFDAFRGIFERFCAKTKDEKLNGMLYALPPDWFGTALLWTVPAGHPFPKRNTHDATGATKLPSWSWVGWTGLIAHVGDQMNDPPHVNMKLWSLERYHSHDLVLQRIGDNSIDWEAVLEEQQTASPSKCITLHIRAPTVTCFLDSSSWDGSNIASLICRGESDSNTEIGVVHIDDPFWLAQQDESKMFQVVLFIDAESYLKSIVPAILTEKAGDCVERVPVAVHVTAPFEVLAKCSKVEHVKLQ